MLQQTDIYDGVDRVLPHSIEAEQSVLGALLIDREAIITVAQQVRPSDFYLEAHSLLFQAMVDLYEERRPLDLITLVDELRQRQVLERVGNVPYLTNLSHLVPMSIHVDHYADIVARLAVKRRLIEAGMRITSLGFDQTKDADAALDAAEKAIADVSQGRSNTGFSSIREILESYLDRLDYIHENRGSVVGVPSGFIDLDKMTGGLQRSDLLILAARPSMGKSAFALSMCHKIAVEKKARIGFFSLEMSKEQLVARLLCMEGGLDSGRLRTGHIDDNEWQRLIAAAAVLAETQIYFDDTAGISTMEMRSKARRLQTEHGLDLLVIDYLQLMQGRQSENRVQEISMISRSLKQLARELNVPVLALSQVSRAVDSRTSHVPMLSDLRESGCLTGDTPVYLPDQGIYRPISELIGQHDVRVLALNTETWQLEPRHVSNAFTTGIKQVFCLTTRLGRSIRATANHKFLTVHGWKRLDEIALGDRLALPRTLPGPAEPTMTTAELALHKANLSRERAGLVATVVSSATLSLLATSDVYWDEVVSIVPDGHETVYDLTVDELHNFVAGDIIVHNSIEQDADVVMFIYRDEVYNADTEKKHIAEIHVAKHRNGPTGQFSLFFNERQAHFLDLDVTQP